MRCMFQINSSDYNCYSVLCSYMMRIDYSFIFNYIYIDLTKRGE